MPQHDYDVIFCGNPGAGKSTLLSCASGLQFNSGESGYSGLTLELEFQESSHFPGCRFADTPGLSDPERAEQAAQAITKALKDALARGRTVKLYFVVPSEAGRITGEHLWTIRQVLQSITLPDNSRPDRNSYGIIVNKMDIDDPEQQESISKRFATESKNVPIPTAHIKYLRRVPELSGKNNARYHFPHLQQFLLDLPGFPVRQADRIDVTDIEAKLQAALEAAWEENERLIMMQELEKREWNAKAAEALKDLRKDLEEKMRQQREVQEQQVELLNAELLKASDGGSETRICRYARAGQCITFRFG